MSEFICPHCKNPIYDEDALLCHFCGHSLNRGSDGVVGKMRGAGTQWIWITLVVVVAVAMLVMLLM
jgi:hypothetical protein